MIDFYKVWLPQIVGYSDLILSGNLNKDFVEKGIATTSITSLDEFFEQVFEDLDSEYIFESAKNEIDKDELLLSLIDDFLKNLLYLEKCLDNKIVHENNLSTLGENWLNIRESCKKLSAYAKEIGIVAE